MAQWGDSGQITKNQINLDLIEMVGGSMDGVMSNHYILNKS